ncbi:IPT/TIG domain-containing protein [Micromonospora sp. DT81.3]|uniref:IPT/TIG domain-containing protein n=1 Tax=Micromonospora sp. DT81.3 TaxID=3416523 RepID=UPI003CF4801E
MSLQEKRGLIVGSEAVVDDVLRWAAGDPSATEPSGLSSGISLSSNSDRLAAVNDMVLAEKQVQRRIAMEIADDAATALPGKLRAIEWTVLAIWLFAFIVTLFVAIQGWRPPDDEKSAADSLPGWNAAFRGDNPVVLAVFAAVIVWVVVAGLAVLRWSSGGAIRMLVNDDNRFSTSKFQAWMWTVILVWVFVFFVIQQSVSGTDILTPETFDLDAEYLLLLGGPFAAVIVATQVTQARIADGEVQKTVSSETKLTDLFANDAGQLDLVDTQYLMFNLVAVAVFGATLWIVPTDLPNLPDGLVLLTSTAALGYITRKAIAKNAPGIISVIAADGTGVIASGSKVRITGVNFVPAGGEDPEYTLAMRVKFGTAVAIPILLSSGQLEVLVPELASGTSTVQVVVVTAGQVESPPYDVIVTNP